MLWETGNVWQFPRFKVKSKSEWNEKRWRELNVLTKQRKNHCRLTFGRNQTNHNLHFELFSSIAQYVCTTPNDMCECRSQKHDTIFFINIVILYESLPLSYRSIDSDYVVFHRISILSCSYWCWSGPTDDWQRRSHSMFLFCMTNCALARANFYTHFYHCCAMCCTRMHPTRLVQLYFFNYIHVDLHCAVRTGWPLVSCRTDCAGCTSSYILLLLNLFVIHIHLHIEYDLVRYSTTQRVSFSPTFEHANRSDSSIYNVLYLLCNAKHAETKDQRRMPTRDRIHKIYFAKWTYTQTHTHTSTHIYSLALFRSIFYFLHTHISWLFLSSLLHLVRQWARARANIKRTKNNKNQHTYANTTIYSIHCNIRFFLW